MLNLFRKKLRGESQLTLQLWRKEEPWNGPTWGKKCHVFSNISGSQLFGPGHTSLQRQGTWLKPVFSWLAMMIPSGVCTVQQSSKTGRAMTFLYQSTSVYLQPVQSLAKIRWPWETYRGGPRRRLFLLKSDCVKIVLLMKLLLYICNDWHFIMLL